MKLSQLVRANLRYYFAAHLGVVIGTALSAAILVGALTVGDSVRLSLKDRAMERLAGAVAVISTGDRYFDDSLDERMERVGPDGLDCEPFVLLELPGTAARQDASARANAIRVIGVPDGFLPGIDTAAADHVWLNPSLARQLHAGAGDELVIRVHKPSALSRDAVITPRDTVAVAVRLKVAGIVPPNAGGDLALQAGQTPPLNAFVSRKALATAASLGGRGNLVWVRPIVNASEPVTEVRLLAELSQRIATAWRLDDAELSIRQTVGNNDGLELISRRIFIESAVGSAALRLPAAGIAAAQPILTYLVNGITSGNREVPYSMVTAAGPPWTPVDLADDEIIVNSWLATELRVKAGDTVDLAYFVADTGPRLVEKTNHFRVRSIVPLEGIYADRSLMPEFPGIAKAESTQDWDAGFPLIRKIRNEDEAYWKKWRGTPKAYISLRSGQRLWANRFGDLTAIRWPAQSDASSKISATALTDQLRSRLHPEEFGLRIDPVRERVLTAAAEGQDFGGLFLSFSFFLLGSSLLLTAMLFRFSLERRAREIGVLMALGWPTQKVYRVLWSEGFTLAMLGTTLGAGLGILYAYGVLWGLATIWKSAVAHAVLDVHLTLFSVALGCFLSAIAAGLTLGLTLRKLVRRQACELLAEGSLDSALVTVRSVGRTAWWILTANGVVAAVFTATAMGGGPSQPGLFFGAGSLWLLEGFLALRIQLYRLARPPRSTSIPGRRLGMVRLAIRGLTRHPSRSLGAAGLLASASFLLCAVGAFKLEDLAGAGSRSSGTGGFALWARTALPVLQDINTPEGREFYSLLAKDLENVSVVPFRVREGDDASCLNLNRAQRPRLLGVDPEALARRRAFSFAELGAVPAGTNGWLTLTPLSTDSTETPAIGDAASLQWILHKGIGDTLDYIDEQGRPFKIRIVGSLESSVLQGNLIIAESELIRRFPGETGHREFLVETPPGREGAVAATLSRSLQDVGFEATPTWERLAQFNAVQNTYLDTFQLLGGLGLLLGSAGFGVIVLRNLHERRGEHGLMLALGFEPKFLVRLAWLENALLLACGLGLGIAAAAVAVSPTLRPGGATLPWASLTTTMGIILVNGLLWTGIAAQRAIRGPVLLALRELGGG